MKRKEYIKPESLIEVIDLQMFALSTIGGDGADDSDQLIRRHQQILEDDDEDYSSDY